MVNLKFLLVAVFLMVKNVKAEVVDVLENPIYAKCTGSLIVVTSNGNVTRFSESKKRTALNVSTLKVEGCGCFYLYKRPNFKSSSKLITHHMTRNSQNIKSDYIGFKIRSIEKVSCEIM